MRAQEFWAAKIVQLLHDPPGKPYFLRPHSGGHKKLARKILERDRHMGPTPHDVLRHKKFARKILERVFPDSPAPMKTAPDLLATGADRPLLTLPFVEGYDLQVFHPLCRSHLRLPHPGNVSEITGKDIDDLKELQIDAASILLESDEIAAAGPDELKKIFLLFWRRWQDEIVVQEGNALLWQLMPADSRAPDHSIWDHNRMASALAFVGKKMEPGQEQEPDHPWLFSFSLRPVQEFLRQARKSQDLWTGSMLLAELSMAAMEPVIEHYGPDVIVYPDLRANPRGDIWLHDHDGKALPPGLFLATRAAVIPHTFVAILPRGAAGDEVLSPLESLGRKVCDRVGQVWAGLAGEVRAWMEEVTDPGSRGSGWKRLWQHAMESCPLEPTWVALPWPVLEKQGRYYWPGGALPFQSNIEHPSPEDRKVLQRREGLLGAWMEAATWAVYDYTLSVFARTNENLLLHSGFCYAPAHHRLKAQHGARRRIMTLPGATPADLSFEKCSLCHTRAALGNSDFGSRNTPGESIREEVRTLWKQRDLDPEETGSERLCAVCATKRYLVRADSLKENDEKPNLFNRVWAGPDKDLGEVRAILGYDDERIRTPFPSTVQIAAQKFLVAVAKRFDIVGKQAVEIIRLHENLGIQRSSFPDSLPALGRAARDYPAARKFLTLDPQLALFPEMVASAANYADTSAKRAWNDLHKQVLELRKALQQYDTSHKSASKKDKFGDPQTQLAVVCMDGDRMGELLLHGSPQTSAVCWKHILHPDVVRRIRQEERFIDSGWGDLLHLPRLSGPSLHAFISRALADFSHTIVPWVVEQEFAGRLIYSGGDDLLALAPADQALDMADRLRSLYASPWIMDTRPDIRPWSWLNGNQDVSMSKPENRFQIITCDEDLPDPDKQDFPKHLMPMLGSGCTMSAGIMYGHFKTPLGTLLHHSHILLDSWAKELAGRNAAGLGHFSRGGVKTMFAARWDTGISGLADTVRRVRDGFAKEGTLPASLPYKLREQGRLLDPFALPSDGPRDQDKTKRIMNGLLRKAVGDGRVGEATGRAVLALWQAGCRLREHPGDRKVDDLAGLFFCRYLSSRTGGES
ncbi:type III-B CRISPR-associated protein Cas10/Cmr2 [Thermodesulfobacteriota bacterium B35]